MNESERDFEADVRRMLTSQVAALPETHEPPPGMVRRARRRRAARLTGVVATVVLVATGTTTAVAQVVAGRITDHVAVSSAKSSATVLASSSTTVPITTTVPVIPSTTKTVPTSLPGDPSVTTIACPAIEARPHTLVPPSTEPRVPAGGNPATFSSLGSFAATTDPSYIVLGPRAWSCRAYTYEDGRRSVELFDPTTTPAVPAVGDAPIAVDIDWLWHGGIGSVTACSVFDDPAIVNQVTQQNARDLPCPRAGRTVTRVDGHVSTFVDADGARGAGWMVLPSAQGADGFVTVLTCRPTAGLTTADCDTIVADFAARLRGTA